MLAPSGSHKFLNYITGHRPKEWSAHTSEANTSKGWLTLIGWQAVFATCNYVESNVIQGLIVMTRSGYQPEPYKQMLLFWAATAFALFFNILASAFLPKLEGFVLLLYFVGFVAVLLPLVIFGEHQDPHQVFGQWINRGEFPTQGLPFMVGLIGAYLVIAGADGAIHVSTFPLEV